MQKYNISSDIIEKFDNNYEVAYPKEKAHEWKEFIAQYLEAGYWNEYFLEKNVVLSLCEKLCGCKFKSIKDMLKENHSYSDNIE